VFGSLIGEVRVEKFKVQGRKTFAQGIGAKLNALTDKLAWYRLIPLGMGIIFARR
jgi:hypothetical protein